MQSSNSILEVKNLTFTGEIDPAKNCLLNYCDNSVDQYGLILNDISFTLHSGEFCLILGSKGSGKKVLLNTLAQLYSKKSIRGRILLNYLPLKKYQFDTYCSYVRNDLNILTTYNGLRVKQILSFGLNVCGSKTLFLHDIYADFVLSHLTNRFYEHLSQSEQKRVLIAFQFLKNPILLLLDEATYNFDPLNTYLMVSILAGLSKKYGTIIISTMDRPRSDIFPFIDHVIYLCLGDIVYSGNTRSMLDYFHSIGFPCPEFENPLMYYLCLCTVDRRSRERFLESNHQMSLLIEKFKLTQIENSISAINFDHTQYQWKSMPSTLTIIFSLYKRFCLMTFQCNNRRSLIQLFCQIFIVPITYILIWLFYNDIKKYQHSFLTRTGFIISVITLTSMAGIFNCISTYHKFHHQFIYETMNGLYNGCTFLIAYNLFIIPLALFSIISNSVFVFLPFLNEIDKWSNYATIALCLWCLYLTNIQQTILLNNLMKTTRKISLITISSIFSIIGIIISSGMLHAMKSLHFLMYYASLVFPIRYISLILGRQLFLTKSLNSTYEHVHYLTSDNNIVESHCNNSTFFTNTYDYCIASSGYVYFQERYSNNDQSQFLSLLLESDNFNILLMTAILFMLILLNLFIISFSKS